VFLPVPSGATTNGASRGLRDVSVREWLVIAPVCARAVVMGVGPGLFLRPIEPAVARTIVEIVGTPGPVNAGAAVLPDGVAVADARLDEAVVVPSPDR